MIGVLLITHAHVASETKAAVEHILGEQTHFIAIDITNSDTSERENTAVESALQSLDNGSGILVMVDLLGATPWNMVQGLATGKPIELIAGFNMPAVIKAVMLREENIGLKELAVSCVSEGCKYMCVGSDAERGAIA